MKVLRTSLLVSLFALSLSACAVPDYVQSDTLKNIIEQVSDSKVSDDNVGLLGNADDFFIADYNLKDVETDERQQISSFDTTGPVNAGIFNYTDNTTYVDEDDNFEESPLIAVTVLRAPMGTTNSFIATYQEQHSSYSETFFETLMNEKYPALSDNVVGLTILDTKSTSYVPTMLNNLYRKYIEPDKNANGLDTSKEYKKLASKWLNENKYISYKSAIEVTYTKSTGEKIKSSEASATIAGEVISSLNAAHYRTLAINSNYILTKLTDASDKAADCLVVIDFDGNYDCSGFICFSQSEGDGISSETAEKSLSLGDMILNHAGSFIAVQSTVVSPNSAYNDITTNYAILNRMNIPVVVVRVDCTKNFENYSDTDISARTKAIVDGVKAAFPRKE